MDRLGFKPVDMAAGSKRHKAGCRSDAMNTVLRPQHQKTVAVQGSRKALQDLLLAVVIKVNQHISADDQLEFVENSVVQQRMAVKQYAFAQCFSDVQIPGADTEILRKRSTAAALHIVFFIRLLCCQWKQSSARLLQLVRVDVGRKNLTARKQT